MWLSAQIGVIQTREKRWCQTPKSAPNTGIVSITLPHQQLFLTNTSLCCRFMHMSIYAKFECTYSLRDQYTLFIQHSSLLETVLMYKQTENLFLVMKKFTVTYLKTELIPPTFRLLNVVPRQDLSPTVPASLRHAPGKHFLHYHRASLHHTSVWTVS